jgi:hypothetical protein
VSGVIHPVGPEKPKVYWVRRLLFLGAIISTLILIISSLRGSGSESVAAVTQSPTPVETALSEVANPTSTPSSGATVTSTPASPTPESSTSVLPTEVNTCSDEQVSLSVSIDPQNPKVSQSMKLTMRIMNTSATACLRDVGSGVNEITIISGPALIWSTDHCNTSTATDVRTLAPNQPVSFTATWDGMQTSKGCIKRNQATSGTYWAHTRNASKNSDGVRFVLAD